MSDLKTQLSNEWNGHKTALPLISDSHSENKGLREPVPISAGNVLYLQENRAVCMKPCPEFNFGSQSLIRTTFFNIQGTITSALNRKEKLYNFLHFLKICNCMFCSF